MHSYQGVVFRQWATGVLKQYLLRGYSVNRQLIALQERTDERFRAIQSQIDEQQQQVEFLVKIHDRPTEQLFPTGCVFDAWEYVAGLVRGAEKRVVLIDNYCDERTLGLLAKRKESVECVVHTRFTEGFEPFADHGAENDFQAGGDSGEVEMRSALCASHSRGLQKLT